MLLDTTDTTSTEKRYYYKAALVEEPLGTQRSSFPKPWPLPCKHYNTDWHVQQTQKHSETPQPSGDVSN